MNLEIVYAWNKVENELRNCLNMEQNGKNGTLLKMKHYLNETKILKFLYHLLS